MSRYSAIIDGHEGDYGVVVPDLPGCTAMGETVEDALLNAAVAARDWARAMRVKRQPVPEPRPLPAILREDPDLGEALRDGAVLASVVLVEDLGRPVRANLSLDAGVLQAIDAEAGRQGITRSGLIEVLAKRGLPQLG